MTVAAVIPCRNEARTLPGLLDAIGAQDQQPDQIVVVDDASTDGTPEVARRWGSGHPSLPLQVVAGPGRGAGPAMNAGVAATGAGIIVRLDGHCRPAPDYIRRSVAALQEPGAGVTGGVWRIEPGASTVAARAIAAVLSHPLGSGGADYRTPPADGAGGPRSVDTVPFGTFRRELWERLGGFDERLLRNQDYDFNYRARLSGLRVIIDPAIVSVYKARPTFGALARQYFDYGFWKVVMLRKFPQSIRVRQALPLMLAPAAGALTLFALMGSTMSTVLLACYLALDLAGGVQASARAGDVRLSLAATAALLTLQLSWSAGAWASLVRGARGHAR